MPRKSRLKALAPKLPSIPLDPKQEAFCVAICNGAKLQQAHQSAGFIGKSHAAAFQLRHVPAVDARIKWILGERVKADTRTFQRRQKIKGDLLSRVVKELEDIAFQDIREVVDWRREPVTNAEGEVVDVTETMAIRDSKALTPAAAKSVKGVFLKSGKLRVEMHDKRAALEALAKILKGDDVQPAGNVTVNQVNVGNVDAIGAAQRVAFLLAAASQRQPVKPEPVTIEGERTDKGDHNS